MENLIVVAYNGVVLFTKLFVEFLKVLPIIVIMYLLIWALTSLFKQKI